MCIFYGGGLWHARHVVITGRVPGRTREIRSHVPSETYLLPTAQGTLCVHPLSNWYLCFRNSNSAPQISAGLNLTICFRFSCALYATYWLCQFVRDSSISEHGMQAQCRPGYQCHTHSNGQGTNPSSLTISVEGVVKTLRIMAKTWRG
jgi:hypothetical protein